MTDDLLEEALALLARASGAASRVLGREGLCAALRTLADHLQECSEERGHWKPEVYELSAKAIEEARKEGRWLGARL